MTDDEREHLDTLSDRILAAACADLEDTELLKAAADGIIKIVESDPELTRIRWPVYSLACLISTMTVRQIKHRAAVIDLLQQGQFLAGMRVLQEARTEVRH
jgi:hypothetical protein